MIYKNMSHTTKTFYGKTFKPGDEYDVPGYINCPGFFRMSEFSKEPPKEKVATKKEDTKTDVKSSQTKTSVNKEQNKSNQ